MKLIVSNSSDSTQQSRIVVKKSLKANMAHRFNNFPVDGPVRAKRRPLALCACGKWSDTTDTTPCAVYHNDVAGLYHMYKSILINIDCLLYSAVRGLFDFYSYWILDSFYCSYYLVHS